MINGMMGSMMSWMMGLGLLGWVLVIVAPAAVLVLLVGLLARRNSKSDKAPPNSA